jgi:hypothetical protein
MHNTLEARGGLSSGRRGSRPPRRRYRTVRETFASHGSSAYGLLSSAPQQLNFTIVAAWSMRGWSWRNHLRSSVRPQASAIRLRLHEHLDHPIDRPHVSVSFALLKAFASWGIPPVCGVRLAACSDGSESHTRVIPFRVSIGRGFRSVLYAGSHFRVETLYPLTTGPVGDQSRLGLPLSR